MRSASHQLVAATDRLTRRYGEVLSPEVIRSILHCTYQALIANATITTYLVVLAERSAARQLAAIADSQTDHPTSAPSGRTVHLRGAATTWQDAIETATNRRWRCADHPADIVLVEPNDHGWSSQDTVLVADTRESPPPAEILAAYNAGASAYVVAATPVTIAAHLDALARRLPRPVAPAGRSRSS